MSKQVTVRFVGCDPNFTNPRLFVNGNKHDYLYCDEDYTLTLTTPETEIYVKVYGYQSKPVILKLNDEIEMLTVEYFSENYDDSYYDNYSMLEEIIDMAWTLLNVMPGIEKSFKEGMVRIECFKRKEYKFKQ